MENQINSTQDCGCNSGDCCQPPKKNNLWKKTLFIVVILAAVAIVTLKMVGKSDNRHLSGNDSLCIHHQKSCCDTSEAKENESACDTSLKRHCCPNSEK